MLLAQWRILAAAAPVKVEATGTQAKEAQNQVLLTPALNEVAAGVSVRNAGDRAIWRTVSATGVPSAPMPAAAEGISVRKSYYNLDGSPANLGALKQNDQIVVVVEGNVETRPYRDLALIDMIPAGFEIEGPVAIGEGGKTVYPWLGDLSSAKVQEARDDRYVAAFSAGWTYRMSAEEEARTPLPSFRFAYVARATIPGTFAAPAVHVEDMYAPEVMARTEMGSVTISAQ